MDITKIKQLFTLFSGDSCTEEQEPLIQLALTEVEAMLTENADPLVLLYLISTPRRTESEFNTFTGKHLSCLQ